METLSAKFASTIRETRQWLEEPARGISIGEKQVLFERFGAQDGAPVNAKLVNITRITSWCMIRK